MISELTLTMPLGYLKSSDATFLLKSDNSWNDSVGGIKQIS